MTPKRPPLPRSITAALVFAAAGTLPHRATASGYYLLEAEARGGVTEDQRAEGGLGLSLYSDELSAWFTLGDSTVDGGRRMKEWWFESRTLGPIMGTLPVSMAAAGFDEPARPGTKQLWIPFRSWRFGSDYSTGRWLEWDASGHLLANLGYLTRVSHRSLMFGPTLGVGANLTWWEGWRGNDTMLINTGKITAEAGWLAGLSLADAAYFQARATGWVDAFGLHQRQLRVAGVLGFQGASLGVPLGLELQWTWERGDDTVDLQPATSSTVMLAATWRLMPRSDRMDTEAIFEALQDLATPDGEDRSSPLPEPLPEPEPEPEPVLDPEGEDEGPGPEPEGEPVQASPPSDEAPDETGRGPQGPEP